MYYKIDSLSINLRINQDQSTANSSNAKNLHTFLHSLRMAYIGPRPHHYRKLMLLIFKSIFFVLMHEFCSPNLTVLIFCRQQSQLNITAIKFLLELAAQILTFCASHAHTGTRLFKNNQS